MASRPEAWQRGPVPGFPDQLQPVAHALIGAAEDVAEAVGGLSAVQLWVMPGGAASIGFHLLHLAGSTDRLFTYARGEGLSDAQKAALAAERALPDLAKAGISVEFIDPRSLKPLDVETLVASARKTRRMLVVEHGHYTAGFGSHVIAEVAQEVPGVKVRKIAFPDVPGPGAAVMMSWLRPDAPKIVDAAVQMMRA